MSDVTVCIKTRFFKSGFYPQRKSFKLHMSYHLDDMEDTTGGPETRGSLVPRPQLSTANDFPSRRSEHACPPGARAPWRCHCSCTLQAKATYARGLSNFRSCVCADWTDASSRVPFSQPLDKAGSYGSNKLLRISGNLWDSVTCAVHGRQQR